MTDLTKSVNSSGHKEKKKNKYFANDPGPRAAE
jgi:hypothetical protein